MGCDSQLARGITPSDSRGASYIGTGAPAAANYKGASSAPGARPFFRSYKGLGHLVNNNTSEATD